MTPEEAKDKLNSLFLDHPDGQIAKSFLIACGIYFHAIDDIIDERITDSEKVLASYMLSLNIYSSSFYMKYRDILYPVFRFIHHTYADSVLMERSSELWQKEQADVLRTIGIEMTLTVVEILSSYATRRNMSIAIREHNYREQHSIFNIT